MSHATDNGGRRFAAVATAAADCAGASEMAMAKANQGTSESDRFLYIYFFLTVSNKMRVRRGVAIGGATRCVIPVTIAL